MAREHWREKVGYKYQNEGYLYVYPHEYLGRLTVLEKGFSRLTHVSSRVQFLQHNTFLSIA